MTQANWGFFNCSKLSVIGSSRELNINFNLTDLKSAISTTQSQWFGSLAKAAKRP